MRVNLNHLAKFLGSFILPFLIAFPLPSNSFQANSAFWNSNWVFLLAGQVGTPGYLDGPAGTSAFSSPRGTAVDSSGNIFVADTDFGRIRKISPTGTVSTFAGDGLGNNNDGTGTAASFYTPAGMTIDTSGNLYIVDDGWSQIRKATPAGVVTTIAGSGNAGYANGYGTAADFNAPNAIARDSSGNLYVTDSANNMIRKIDTSNNVTLFSGAQSPGTSVGSAANARYNNPSGIAVDGSNNIFVADTGNNRILKLVSSGTAAGQSSVFAGSTTNVNGYTNGTGTAARFYNPMALVADGTSSLYVADYNNNVVRKIVMSNQSVTTVAGNQAVRGSLANTGTAASFWGLQGISIDSSKNLYLADSYGGLIRKITTAQVATTYAGAGSYGQIMGTGSAATFTSVKQIVADASGNIFAVDRANHQIRKITPAGAVTLFAGSTSGGFTDGTGAAARFYEPNGIAIDSSGNLYVADLGNSSVRKITTAGAVTTLAGNGTAGYADGSGTAARFNLCAGLTVDTAGNVYVADSGNNRIRKITSAGAVTTLAGSGTADYVEGTGTAAAFNFPNSIAVDPAGNLFVSDSNNAVIRKITTSNVVSTFAGSGNYGANDGVGTAATFSNPEAITIDSSNALYVADTYNYSIRKITPGAVVSTVMGSPQTPYTYLGRRLAQSGLSTPTGIAVTTNRVYVSVPNGIVYFRK